MSTSQLTKGTSRSIAPLCFELLFASFWASRGNQLPTQGKRWEVGKKNTSLYPSSSASTGIVKQSAERFALRGWTSCGIITMPLPAPLSVPKGTLGNGNNGKNDGKSFSVTRIELRRLLRTDKNYEKEKQFNLLLSLNLVFCLSVGKSCTVPFSLTLRSTCAL